MKVGTYFDNFVSDNWISFFIVKVIEKDIKLME